MNTRTHKQFAALTASILITLSSHSTTHAGADSNEQKILVRTTAYTHSEADHTKYGKSTAAGTQLRAEVSYTSAASDWSVFPLGTTFKIKGDSRTFVIDDYGTALVGSETIDIYKPNVSLMNTWGVKHVEIKILKFGCYQKSLKLLAGRVHHAHCKQMHSAIKRQIRS